jgi:hypothetical protein
VEPFFLPPFRNNPLKRCADNLIGEKSPFASLRSARQPQSLVGQRSFHEALPTEFATLSMDSDEAHRHAEALFKKDQQAREGQQGMAGYD